MARYKVPVISEGDGKMFPLHKCRFVNNCGFAAKVHLSSYFGHGYYELDNGDSQCDRWHSGQKVVSAFDPHTQQLILTRVIIVTGPGTYYVREPDENVAQNEEAAAAAV